MKKSLVLAAAGLILGACASEKPKEHKSQDANGMDVYANEYFSIKYPSDWEYEEEISEANDTLPVITEGIRATFYSSNPTLPWHTVMIQKSAMPAEALATPEEWRDMSVGLKKFDDQYLGYLDEYMQDSIKFGQYPAAMAGFVVATEEGDTLVQKQTIVKVGETIYYLNNTYDWNDDGTLESLGDSILSTIRFKGK